MPKGTTTRNKNLGSFLARLTKCQPREFAVPIYNESYEYKIPAHEKEEERGRGIVSVRSPKLMGKWWYLSFQHTEHTEKMEWPETLESFSFPPILSSGIHTPKTPVLILFSRVFFVPSVLEGGKGGKGNGWVFRVLVGLNFSGSC